MASGADDDALRQVAQALLSLKENERFHGEICAPDVNRAVRHWTGVERLKPEECEDWQSNPRIMFVLAEFRRLEYVCKKAGLKVPLDTVLACTDEMVLPDGRKLSHGEVVQMEQKADAFDLDDLPLVPPVNWKRTLMWQLLAMVLTLLLTHASMWYHRDELGARLQEINASMQNQSRMGEL
eukprot:TRINITY_DN30810_c0_g1_i1.p1 TRINITY_DN30810_c0_g1~~TRINITY_DN30810_c0_g1_i1.p1  ORF type:complete len:181 (-),score=36.13 TRINITY_DN30810_c0_g1_i1:70-612(-)